MNANNAKIWEQRQKEREKKLLRMQNKKPQNYAGFFRRNFYPAVLILGAGFLLMAFSAYFYKNYAVAKNAEAAGTIINVKSGGDFQAALDRAKPGDTIVLQSGATFAGNFSLPKKDGNDFVTIRSSAADAQLPPADVRIEPDKYAAVLPKIVTPNSNSAISTTEGAHHFRFIGVEFTVAKPELQVWNLISIGDDQQNTTAQVPHHIVFDRCFIHAGSQEIGSVRNGLALNGSNIELLNSEISDFRLPKDEGHAIVAWNAPGPFRIVNNFIEAAGINVLFGGATANKKMNPADLEFRRNLVAKKLEWRGKYAVKNLLELKDMRRAVIEENIFENNWVSEQKGTAIVLTPVSSQSGDDARVEDIVFRSNIIRRTANAVGMSGTDYNDPKYPNLPVQNRGVKFENNLFTEIDDSWGDENSGRFLLLTSGAGPDDLTIDHNTIINTGNLLVLDSGISHNVIFTNNIAFHNQNGIIGVGERGSGIGSEAIKTYISQAVFRKNIIIGADSKKYPAENFYTAKVESLKFVDFKAGNFQLDIASALRGKATDGKDLGCDFAAIKIMEQKVLTGKN